MNAISGFSGSNTLISGSTPVDGAPFTVAGWFKLASTGTTQVIFSLCDSAADADRFSVLVTGSDKLALGATDAGGTTTTTTATVLAAGDWHWFGAVFASSTDRTILLDDGSDFATSAAERVPASIDRLGVGCRATATPASHFSGSIANLGVWSESVPMAKLALLFGRRMDVRDFRRSTLVWAPNLRRVDDLLGANESTSDVDDGVATGAFDLSTGPVLAPRCSAIGIRRRTT